MIKTKQGRIATLWIVAITAIYLLVGYYGGFGTVTMVLLKFLGIVLIVMLLVAIVILVLAMLNYWIDDGNLVNFWRELEEFLEDE